MTEWGHRDIPLKVKTDTVQVKPGRMATLFIYLNLIVFNLNLDRFKFSSSTRYYLDTYTIKINNYLYVGSLLVIYK